MDELLWKKVLAFDLDAPGGEFTFTIRLAQENQWTEYFTQKAVLEYKKFMFLAATAGRMVSPSEVVDEVWHLHLTYSKSYTDFCKLLGRDIHHIPSSQSAQEKQQFREARTQTMDLYKRNFGEPPEDIWMYDTMWDSLKLPKAKYKLRTKIIFSVLGYILFCIPGFWLLKPVYAQLDSFLFFIFYFFSIIGSVLFFMQYNRSLSDKMVKAVNKHSFINHMTALEMTYLLSNEVGYLVNAVVDRLVRRKVIQIGKDYKLTLSSASTHENHYEYIVIETMKANNSSLFYPALLSSVQSKPAFSNFESSMQGITKYFHKSIVFNRLFMVNFYMLTTIIFFGLERIFIGLSRDKEVGFICIVVLITIAVTTIYLTSLARKSGINSIIRLYDYKLESKMERGKYIEYWGYYYVGTAYYASEFSVLADYVKRNSSSDGSSSGGSCGSSCGSSCGGGGCGGCGGGD